MKRQIGTGPCLACGETIPYKEADSGALSVCCPWCDFSGYGRQGTQARSIIAAKMKPATKTDPEPEPAPTPAIKPAPAAKPKPATIFG
ncbi:MAG: hypothetical protein DI561_15015 [Thauera sp.]|nr:MAG: hypothetical protein DI561_15015 [Thauera sp.]